LSPRLRVILGGRPPPRGGLVELTLPETSETGRELSLDSGVYEEDERFLGVAATHANFWVATASSPIDQCYMEIEDDGDRVLWVGDCTASFVVTPDEFDQIAATFSPLGLAVYNGPAPDDEEDDDPDPEAS
jgi:hypothetical protein